MRILGPLVCSTTLPMTETFASASASVVTSPPSTTSTTGKVCSVPGLPSSFSRATTAPTPTFYCLPPVLTIAYADTGVSCLLDNGWGLVRSSRPRAVRESHNAARSHGGPQYRLRAHPDGG